MVAVTIHRMRRCKTCRRSLVRGGVPVVMRRCSSLQRSNQARRRGPRASARPGRVRDGDPRAGTTCVDRPAPPPPVRIRADTRAGSTSPDGTRRVHQRGPTDRQEPPGAPAALRRASNPTAHVRAEREPRCGSQSRQVKQWSCPNSTEIHELTGRCVEGEGVTGRNRSILSSSADPPPAPRESAACRLLTIGAKTPTCSKPSVEVFEQTR